MNKEKLVLTLGKYDPWRLIGMSLGAGIIVVAGALAYELAALSWQGDGTPRISSNTNTIDPNSLSDLLSPESKSIYDLEKAMRKGLFRPATPTRDNTRAQNTIDKIKKQLQLKYIDDFNGELFAYIEIEQGPKARIEKCKAGDVVTDLFTVIEVYEKSVAIKIVEHRIILTK